MLAASGVQSQQWSQGLYSELTTALAQLGLEGLEPDMRISQEFLGRGSLLAIKAFTPRGSLCLGREEKFGIPSNATNKGGVVWKVFK